MAVSFVPQPPYVIGLTIPKEERSKILNFATAVVQSNVPSSCPSLEDFFVRLVTVLPSGKNDRCKIQRAIANVRHRYPLFFIAATVTACQDQAEKSRAVLLVSEVVPSPLGRLNELQGALVCALRKNGIRWNRITPKGGSFRPVVELARRVESVSIHLPGGGWSKTPKHPWAKWIASAEDLFVV